MVENKTVFCISVDGVIIDKSVTMIDDITAWRKFFLYNLEFAHVNYLSNHVVYSLKGSVNQDRVKLVTLNVPMED